ncbi:MAG TPA: saccharopine dehydrogenase NADP-binding domain-containing protein [Thermoplasmata archaeon]|nr:saccharopine dehydrogenase NADP-binding domain-containing protein [Thermoplasmata archaeon]
MKVAVLGIGGLGRILALELASDARVTDLVLADKRGDRSKALKSIGHGVSVRPIQVDVGEPGPLRDAIHGADLVINATLPDYNLPVMAACLDVGCSYIDPWGLSPVAPAERPGVLAQLDEDAAWKDRGLTAVVSMGSDPGLSNVMARAAADRLATLDEIRILKAAAGTGDFDGYPLYSRTVFLRDALSPPTIWDGKQIAPQPFVSGEEDYEFPAPVGKRHLYQFYHEEVLTLPYRLGRPVGRVVYKHDINPELVRAIAALDSLGLLREDRRILLGKGAMTFRDAFLATFPEPSALIGPIPGTMAIVSEVIGSRKDGSRARVRASFLLDHREANRRRGATAERYVTSAAVASAAALLIGKKMPRTGVLAAEELPLGALLPELEARGVAFRIEETAP